MASQPSKKGANRRCRDDQYGPCMEFVYAGPYRLHTAHKPLTKRPTSEAYIAGPGGHTIESALRATGRYSQLVSRFGRKPMSRNPRQGRRRRRDAS